MSPKPDENQTENKAPRFLAFEPKTPCTFYENQKKSRRASGQSERKKSKNIIANLQEILLFFSYASQNLFSLFSKHVKNSVIVFGEIVSNVAGIIFI